MKIGDKVKVIGIPPDLPVDITGELNTQETFHKAVGKIFKIKGFYHAPEINKILLELHVGKLSNQSSYMDTIYIEEEFVEKV